MKTLFLPLKSAQGLAAKWITGAFRTSPLDGLDVLAGLMPIRLHVRKLCLRAQLRLRRLPDLHPLLTSLPAAIAPAWATTFSFGPVMRHMVTRPRLPLHHAAASLAEPHQEMFMPMHAEAHLGFHLVDEYSSCLVCDMSHPPRKSDAFAPWLDAFKGRLAVIADDPSSFYAFTDGSVLSKQGYRSTAAWRSYQGPDITSQRAFSVGRASSFDAEIAALVSALRHLVTSIPAATTTIHLFADNESALNSLFDCKLHSSQMLSVLACKDARSWLSERPDRQIQLHWCPGHCDIPQNDAVDDDADRAHQIRPIASHESYAYAKQRITHRMRADWACITTLGQGFFPNPRLKRVSHTHGGGLTLTMVGDDSRLAARYVRTVLNHAPTGEYRTRFFPHEEHDCPDCHVLQMRRHILDSCTRYQRPHANFSEFLKNSSEPGSRLLSFLQTNPSAFTFADAPTPS
ncbi:hypothetical protein EWM64_g3673 [Hericium alpestre]|uniref:RNase H type-1 domain-containing protein n=1 Tax=Hericium alpestre TaxID=135208 RepID=A0A4Z0A390_9AGAM|nr:hypothetical protein EWM64_g3673 [Hericium alpestre]